MLEPKVKREQYRISIRRDDNERIFQNKRRLILRESLDPNESESVVEFQSSNEAFLFYSQMKDILMEGIIKNDEKLVLEHLCITRNQSSKQDEGLSNYEVTESQIVPVLIEILRTPSFKEDPRIVGEAIWILSTFFAGSGDHVHYLLSQGILPVFAGYLRDCNANLFEHISWAVANMLADPVDLCFAMSHLGIWEYIIEGFERYRKNKKIIRVCSWLFANAVMHPTALPDNLVNLLASSYS